MTHDAKVIIIDIDFSLNNIHNVDNKYNMTNLLQQICSDQHLILCTNANWHQSQNYLELLNIKVGYLISNAGGVIYDIGAKKYLFEQCLSDDVAQAVAHAAIIKNFIVIVNDKSGKQIAYKLDDWTEKFFLAQQGADFPQPIILFNTWQKFVHELKFMEIHSIEIYCPLMKQQNNKLIDQFIVLLNKIMEIEVFKIKNKLYITAKHANRAEGLKKISQLINLHLMRDGMYLGVNSFAAELINQVYFSVTSSEVYHLCNGTNIIQPTVWFNNTENAWIHWLNDHDYLWAYQPSMLFQKQLANYYQYLSETELLSLQDEQKKVFYLTKNAPLIHLKQTKKQWNWLWLAKNKNFRDDHQVDEVLLMWPETKIALIEQFKRTKFGVK